MDRGNVRKRKAKSALWAPLTAGKTDTGTAKGNSKGGKLMIALNATTSTTINTYVYLDLATENLLRGSR